MTRLLAEAAAHRAFDAWRYLTVLEGVTLMVIGMWRLHDAWKHSWPPSFRRGLVLRWAGRVLLVAFACVFVLERLGRPLNWYTPVVWTSFTLSLAGILTMKVYDRITFGEDV